MTEVECSVQAHAYAAQIKQHYNALIETEYIFHFNPAKATKETSHEKQQKQFTIG